MKFTKMHGAGNDYIYVNGFEEAVPNPSELSVKISDRHFGIGGDGLVLILPSETADFRMRMFNADGSEGNMCGNAIRCVAKYVFERSMTAKTDITIETLSGIKKLTLFVNSGGVVNRVRVWMGLPVFPDKEDCASLPKAFPATVKVQGKELVLYPVSMGNPHAVRFVDNVDEHPVEAVGSAVQQLPLFPNSVNVEFIKVLSRAALQMRVWERGSGETLACGTGACASAVVAMRLGLVDKTCEVQLRGGNLTIEWQEDGVYMTGPATEVFSGRIETEEKV